MFSTKEITASCITATVLLTGSAQAALTDGLVAYYDFESDLTNQAGSGDLSVVAGNDGIAGWSGGVVNASDGTSNRSTLLVGNAGNYIDVENDRTRAPFGTDELGNSFTISAWYYLAPNDSNGSSRYFVFESLNNFDVSYGISSGDTYASYVGQIIVDSTDTSRNAWHHVLHVFDSDATNTTLSVYIDGTFEGSGSAPTSTVDFDAINLGYYRSDSGDRDWDGLIDEVAIWDRALTTQEVLDVRAAGLAGSAIPEPGSLALLGLGGLLIARRRRSA